MVSTSSTRERNSTSSSAPSGRMKQTWGEKIVPHPGKSRTWRKAGLGVSARAVSIPDGKVPDTGDRSTIAAETPAGPATMSAPKIGRSKRGSGNQTQWRICRPRPSRASSRWILRTPRQHSSSLRMSRSSPSSCPSMLEKTESASSGFSSGKPIQAPRIVSAREGIRGATVDEDSDGGDCIKPGGTEWNFATQF